jgi:hypothetical protein
MSGRQFGIGRWARLALVLVFFGVLGGWRPEPAEAAAVAFKVGSFTKSTTTGNQVVAHGLGTTPKLLLVWTNANTNESFASPYRFTFGATDGTTPDPGACAARTTSAPPIPPAVTAIT